MAQRRGKLPQKDRDRKARRRGKLPQKDGDRRGLNACAPAAIRAAVLAGGLILGVGMGRGVWESIKLPFRNPWEVISPLAILEYNPDTNVVRFLVFILLPTSLLLALFGLGGQHLRQTIFSSRARADIDSLASSSGPRVGLVLVGLALLAMVVALNIPTETASGPFDTFHEGQALGPAVSYLHGMAPYKDFTFEHGLIQDPLRCVVAFKLFGRSIGATRTVQSITKLVAFALLAVVIGLTCEGNGTLAFAALIGFLVMNFVTLRNSDGRVIGTLGLMTQRDFTMYAFLAALLVVSRLLTADRVNPRRLAAANFLCALTASVALTYSVERGIYLIIGYLVLWPILFWCIGKRTTHVRLLLISAVAGLLSGIAVLAVLIRGNLGAFIRYVIIQIRYFSMQDGLPYPAEQAPAFLVLVLAAFVMFWLVYRYLSELNVPGRGWLQSSREFARTFYPEIALVATALLHFRSSLGRADWVHISIAANPLYLCAFAVVFRHWVPPLLRRTRPRRFAAAIMGCTAACCLLYMGTAVLDEDLLAANFPLGVADDDFIPSNYRATIDFLKSNLGQDEYFMTTTSEGSWYYFVDRPAPTRFICVCYANPSFYQREVVESLRKHRVKYVLYRNANWSNAIDGVPTEMRLPIVFDYIKKNYRFLRRIDDNEILINRSEDDRGALGKGAGPVAG